MFFPCFRNHHHDSVRQRVAAHHQQFERIVKSGGIGLTGVDQGPYFLQVLAQQRRGNPFFTGQHPVIVAAYRVDFAIVRNHAERVRQVPLRKGVGGKTLMHQGQCRNAARILQVFVVDPDLIGKQQPFVHDRARRHGDCVIALGVLQFQALDCVGGPAANNEETALQSVCHQDIAAPADKYLAYHRFLLAHGRRHRHIGIDRHVAPAEDHLPLAANGALDLFLACGTGRAFARQKNHADAIFTGPRQSYTLFRHFLAV